MTMDSGLANRLKGARKYLGVSQEYVANFLNISRTSLTNIESANRKVSSDELKLLSELYGWTSDELLFGKEVSEPTTVFARAFSSLSETDKREIMNLIEFKKRIRDEIYV